MTDNDLITLNNIMISSSNSMLTMYEQNQYMDYNFNTDKAYFDVCLSILHSRQVTNTLLNSFYLYAKTQGFSYNSTPTNDDILWMGVVK